MAGWKVVLKHKNGVDKVEVIGIGSDPHKPVEVVKTSEGPAGKKILERIEKQKEIDLPPPIIPIFSPDDMYLYNYLLAKIADSDPDWELESDLPPLPNPFKELKNRDVFI